MSTPTQVAILQSIQWGTEDNDGLAADAGCTRKMKTFLVCTRAEDRQDLLLRKQDDRL